MASSDDLPKGMAKTLAGQLQGLAGRAPKGSALAPPKPKAAPEGAGPKAKALPPPAPAKIAESFAVCVVTPDQVDPAADPAVVARPTGRWHHLIRSGPKAKGRPLGGITQFARSSEQRGFDGGFAPKVTQFGPCANPDDVEAAITVVDEKYPADKYVVRWLEVLGYYVVALLVAAEGEAHVVVIGVPDSFTQLKKGDDYPLKEFFTRLLKEPKPV